MSELIIPVTPTLAGVRVDRAIALVADLSRSAVSSLIAGGQVTIDGIVVRSRSVALRDGQTLRVETSDDDGARIPEADDSVPFEVVYEDDDIVVVDKPAGVVVHPGAGHVDGTLVSGLLARYPEIAALADEDGAEDDRPGIVHRLDRGTSGLMLVARSAVAYRSLVAQLGERAVDRTYRALAIGLVEADSGVVDAPIGRSVTSPTRMAVSSKGKEARTRYEVEQRFELPAEATLLTAKLETGRTHQIRVHLSAIGHPLVGDDVYGRGRSFPLTLIERPFLHAYQLAVTHPVTAERMTWTSELPDDLVEQLGALEV